MADYEVVIRRSDGRGRSQREEHIFVSANTHNEARAAAEICLDNSSVILSTERSTPLEEQL